MYADIVIPVSAPVYTYEVDDELAGRIDIGHCVAVRLGNSGYCPGVVCALHNNKPAKGTTRKVTTILHSFPKYEHYHIDLWFWAAEYYMCYPGDILRAGLPPAWRKKGADVGELIQLSPKKPHTEYIQLNGIGRNGELPENINKLLGRSHKQAAAFDKLLALLEEGRFTENGLERTNSGIEPAILRQLGKKGLLTLVKQEKNFSQGNYNPNPSGIYPKVGMDPNEVLKDPRPLLVRSTTEGRLGLYEGIISESLQLGKNVLFLVPDISASILYVSVLSSIFGDRVIPYHSGLTDKNRNDSLFGIMASEGGNIIVGTRSAIFLPVKNMGLIILEDEHDGSYKQNDSNPRYNSRSCGVVLARMLSIPIVLGSSTPSLESYNNALKGKYRLAEFISEGQISNRPDITISDSWNSIKRGERNTHFNKILLDKLRDNLDKGGQALLFHNKRGFRSFTECRECGHIYKCPECNIPLTFHKSGSILKCHFCGYNIPQNPLCPACGERALESSGFGTEKIEEEISSLFPTARVSRMDADVVKNPQDYKKIIDDFIHRRTDIIIGTLLLAKSYDFPGGSLSAILNADSLLAFPDFRASEKAYHIISQIAERTGTPNYRGEVVIQSSQSSLPYFNFIGLDKYPAMYRYLMEERREFKYPPFTKLIQIELKTPDLKKVDAVSVSIYKELKCVLNDMIIGPVIPVIEKIRGEYIRHILVKIPQNESSSKIKTEIRNTIGNLSKARILTGVKISYNIDPY